MFCNTPGLYGFNDPSLPGDASWNMNSVTMDEVWGEVFDPIQTVLNHDQYGLWQNPLQLITYQDNPDL